jgi:hypothetical protein
MLSDDQIEALSPDQRRELIWRLARSPTEVLPRGYDMARARRNRVALMAICATFLVPWIVYLEVSLPKHYVARHWTLTWVGFDVILGVLFASTAVLGVLRRELVALTAFASGVLLLCDAWFDITTANAHDRSFSIFSAVAAEVPIALVLISSALRLVRVTARRVYAIGPREPLWRAPLLMDVDHAEAVTRRLLGRQRHAWRRSGRAHVENLEDRKLARHRVQRLFVQGDGGRREVVSEGSPRGGPRDQQNVRRGAQGPGQDHLRRRAANVRGDGHHGN